MNIFTKLWQGIGAGGAPKSTQTLAASTSDAEKMKRFLAYKEKALSSVRQDIKTWKTALASAYSDEPKNYPLQLLYGEIDMDALLTSQVENRTLPTVSSPFSLLTESGEKDEEQTLILKQMAATAIFHKAVLAANDKGNTVVELSLTTNIAGDYILNVEVVPRTNIVQQRGLFYPDYSEDTTIKYREMAEYGTYILEFKGDGMGRYNKAVPHVLFKRFAQSCWSELCEIYGIPPRVMKTDTQDTVMLNRAEQMMADMGAAAWFIIDDSETFEWAQGVSTDGSIYEKLMRACANEICLLFSGAIIGQDTVNGNRSKEESSQNMLYDLILADKAAVQTAWNTTILPALVNLGLIKPGLRFEFDPQEDLKQLWSMTKDALQHMTIEPEWIKEKFGIPVTGERQKAPEPGDKKLSLADLDFFV